MPMYGIVIYITIYSFKSNKKYYMKVKLNIARLTKFINKAPEFMNSGKTVLQKVKQIINFLNARFPKSKVEQVCKPVTVVAT